MVGAGSFVSVTETSIVEVPTADVPSDFSGARKQPAEHDNMTAIRTIAEAIRRMEFEIERFFMQLLFLNDAPQKARGESLSIKLYII